MDYLKILGNAMGSRGYVLAKILATQIGNRSECSTAHAVAWTPMCQRGELMRYKTCEKGHAVYILPKAEAFLALVNSKDKRFTTWCDPKNAVMFDEKTKTIVPNLDLNR